MTLTTARDIREAVVSGKASAVEIARAALARIEQTNPTLNAFNHLVSERAIARATLIDQQRAAGASLGP
jgi:Asp-tRNA(Asn)/Glu-tRNA(Gln) amidotransferase A subunit family amidase